ncbi:hypothetical protein CCR75_008242 [Bremia lactucae]|uniref:Protein NO VEIN C-terminal domain-containing protein n=1 Tax=Bremia lactucae TaxID=4779 RepID=A0A976ID28_BRELC|nr:hypothetical protein CCR75_008242 [Bremia lactucae]
MLEQPGPFAHQSSECNMREGRGNWQRFQLQHHGQIHASESSQRRLTLASSHRSSFSAQVQKDVVAFIETFRANHSDPSAPPNALTLDIVVHAICDHFHVNSFEELMGMSALQLPALRQLHTVNQRLWTFITCYVQSRRINTLFECHQAFLQQEGLRFFHELKLGNSFLHTEAVQNLYFSPRVMYPIATRDVLACLRQYGDMLSQDAFRPLSHVDLHEFLQYIAQHYRQSSAQAMGIFIDSSGFGIYVGMLRRIANYEMKELKTLEQQFQSEVAERMFRLSKEKFSAENRKRALDEMLRQTNNQTEKNDTNYRRCEDTKSSVQSLSLDMLNRVTEIDVYLDNVLHRKAAANTKISEQYRRSISSQEIAETDSKLRNQLTQFLMSSLKSKHHSRLKVVTWVMCSILAKTYALLLSDDKLPVKDETDSEKVVTESEKEECECCCVGKNSCTCSCYCKCHIESSDEENEHDDGKIANLVEKDVVTKMTKNLDTLPVSPADPFAATYKKLNKSVNLAMRDIKTEVDCFLNAQRSNNHPDTAKSVLLILSSLEKHLVGKFEAKTKSTTWAGRRSILQLLPELLDDADNKDDDSASKWFLSLLQSDQLRGTCVDFINTRTENVTEDMLKFVLECRATINLSASLSSLSNKKQLQWIADRLSVRFAKDLSQGNSFLEVENMVKMLDQETRSEESSVVKDIGTLDLQYDGDQGSGKDTTGEFKQVLTEQALGKLCNCPYIVDVSLYMNWQELYAPLCGPLLSFIRVHEMILLDHAPSNSLLFVCCLNGTILRLNEKSTPSDLELLFRQAVRMEGQVAASQVATHLVSMVVTCKGFANFPKQLVQAHLRAFFTRYAGDEDFRKHFMLDVLVEVPVEFADFVMLLLLDAVGHADNSNFADQIWKACRSDAERKVLLYHSKRSLLSLYNIQSDQWCGAREALIAALPSPATNTCVDTNCERLEAAETSAPSIDAIEIEKVVDNSSVVYAEFEASDMPTLACESTHQEAKHVMITEANTEICRSYIEDLRKKQFGVGLKVQDDVTTSVLLKQQQRLERALKRLSDELYSESTHFVLELLQNADDNTYEEMVTPRGEFSLTADNELIFYNNEQGFSYSNIQAICDVGASTKALVDSEASIGRKGIGFKSVFKVSDNPQIHSNGFHICFHAKSSSYGNGVGYILPHWLDDRTQWKKRRGTTFVLPLSTSSMQGVKDISASLFALKPSVLLFLRRIRDLRLVDMAQKLSLNFYKKEVKLQNDYQLVHLFSRVRKGENSVDVAQQQWIIVKKTLDPPQMFACTPSTEIALALPVRQGEDTNDDRPPLQQVFCYLPLRSYGLRFVLQGDFEIPSSREAITNGSEWNAWLISNFPSLVRAAVTCYISTLQASEMIAGPLYLLSLLPDGNEVQAPFRSIVPEVMRQLRTVKWLPTLSPKTEFYMPTELIDCLSVTSGAGENPFIFFEALSDDVLSTFNKHFLHPALSQSMSGLIKSQLQIEHLHASHLMRLLSLSAEKNDVDWTVRMLSLLAKLWRKDRHSGLLRQELRLIKCFPLKQDESANGMSRWISLAGGHDSVFLSNIQTGNNASREDSDAHFSDLRILDGKVTDAASKNLELRAFFLNDVGLHVMEDHELIRHHILPKMTELHDYNQASNAKKADFDAMIQYGRYLAFHLAMCNNCPLRMDVKSSMVVATSCSRLVRVDCQNLFGILPSTYCEVTDLFAWVKLKGEALNESGNSLLILTDNYFSNSSNSTLSKDLVDKQWHYLFVETCDLPILVNISSFETDVRSQAGMRQLLTWIEDEKDVSVKRRISMQLAQYLDKHWTTTKDGPGANGIVSTDDKDAALDVFRKYCWLEGSDTKFHRSIDLWLSTDETTRLFAPDMVTFSSLMWRSDDFSKRILGMKSAATVADALAAISAIAMDSNSVPSPKVEQIIRLYMFLWEESQISDANRVNIFEEFSRKAMIFVPSKEKAQCCFIRTINAVWSASIQKGELVVLEALYPMSLSNFFIEVCGVQRKPSTTLLCNIISSQQDQIWTKGGNSKQPHDIKVWKKTMLPLLCALARNFKKRSLAKGEKKIIKKALKSTLWLPVRSLSGRNSGIVFCSSRDKPVRATTEDERKLQTLALSLTKKAAESGGGSYKGEDMRGEDDIHLIQYDLIAENTDFNPLLSLMKVSTLSSHLKDHADLWGKLIARLTKFFQPDYNKYRKKLLKISQLLVKLWAKAFSMTSIEERSEFQAVMQYLMLFPTIGESLQWVSGNGMYINDQTELSKEVLEHSGQSQRLQILGLFPLSYFVIDMASRDGNNEASLVQTFLMQCFGMKSLKAHLQCEVSVLSTQQPASDAFHEKIYIAFSLAQRFLFHQYRHLYDQLPHDSIANLASEFHCVLVDGHDGFQVVYRVKNSFCLRRGADMLSRCFLDVCNRTLYLQRVTGDEEARALSLVLMELSRKLFGAQVAPSVANLLYLGLLQPSALSREQWLLETQSLPPLPNCEARRLWTSKVQINDDSSLERANYKRALKDMEDGEIGDHEALVQVSDYGRKTQALGEFAQSSRQTASFCKIYDDHGHHDRHTHIPPNLPYNIYGGADRLYHLPLSELRTHSLSLSNTMTKEERKGIGRWGEEYVFNQLKQQHAESEVTVEWLNEKEESGLPYDLMLSRAKTILEYIEVKSTRTMEKGLFEISLNELNEATIHGSTYCIYRVFNAGNSALCRVIRLENPVLLLRQHKIQLALVMQ